MDIFLEKLTITGFRGFESQTEVSFAKPNGKEGSGLTVFVGHNNSGKSSILECLRTKEMIGHNIPNFPLEMRNQRSSIVEIKFDFSDNLNEKITSQPNSSIANREPKDTNEFKIFTLQSRRNFNPYFIKPSYEQNVEDYLKYHNKLNFPRLNNIEGFENRLFNIISSDQKKEFDNILRDILGREINWTIDSNAAGSFLKLIKENGISHSSDGLGEGVVSLFTIADLLYTSQKEEKILIAIDEPELSLHPSAQKLLSRALLKYSKDKQIVIFTHSPYFIELEGIENGSSIIRVSENKIYSLSTESKNFLVNIAKNINNPHMFGLDAKEIFFLDDGIVLTEGQEDVVLFPVVFNSLKKQCDWNFFGWGCGGAANIPKISKILNELGFKKVVAIFDHDEEARMTDIDPDYNYHVVCIPADDIRFKEVKEIRKNEKDGLLKKDEEQRKYQVQEKYQVQTSKMIDDINQYLNK